jgi:type I restriction enzyme S subunit
MFKSWFVDFDPVIDNALDAGNEIPEPLQARAELRQKVRASQDFQPLPAEVRALFPAEFEESELGWMPKGWEVQALFDLAEFINGAAYKAFNPNTIKMGKPIIKIAELKSGITESTAYSDIDMPSKYLLQDSDILFSWSGNPDTSIDTFVWSLGEAWLNQHIFKVVPKNIKHRSYVLMTLKYLKPTFTAIARDKQTTGLGHVTVKDLKELLLPIPASVTIETTGNLFNSYLDQIFGLTKQIQNLISLRDALLPKLISGELALDDLPADVAEAAEAV